MGLPRRRWRPLLVWLALLCGAAQVHAADLADCAQRAGAGCLRAFDLPGNAGRMHYYLSRAPDGTSAPRTALLILHGHPRDAEHSFDAGLQAARTAGQLAHTLVVAPLYQVPADRAGACSTPGTPAAQPGDALWTCAGWLAGERSLGPHPIGAFSALDALLVELARQWPSLRSVTLVGFSAGAQMLQHSIAFAAEPPTGLALRYVIADPGSWLYFDPVRPSPQRAGQPVPWHSCDEGGCNWAFSTPPSSAPCAGFDDWKYGTRSLPAHLTRDATQARARYAAAQVDYLEGALDSSAQKGAFYPILDKSCAAMLQGPFRLQRGLAYAAYDNAVLKSQRPRRMVVVPGCAHEVACVIASPAAQPLLFPQRP